MAGHAAALVFDLIARGNAPAEFIRLAGAADKAAAATARAEKRLATSSAVMSRTGAKLTKGLTLPLLAVAAVGVHQAAKWQTSMTLIQTAGGETAAKTAELSKGLQKLATETGTSLDDLGEGIYTIAKAGAQKWSAVDQLLVMKAAAQGAKAENVSLGVATDALSTVMLDYHTSASKAVEVENQLIRASGLAKTNFGLFSESLSNVTPIAAALHVSFAEIGGAIATMTQHGVSAQRATENLRNLLFNLSGQNNVASQAMQQLGIDTVDLTQHLGERGLTGTLAIVDKALKDHTKDGMVVIDVHKAAALAARSLTTMLSSMSGPLREQSKGLTTGKVSIKEYQQYAKSLGGEAGASALQFKSLYLNSVGFSNQLKSGKGTITTSTAQYAKLLNGMTGASVAMQIGGKYAKDNAKNVKLVGEAALEAGADVLGWDKTQGTLAVKLDKAKASLQVMAVEIGTALIPAVSKVVGWVSKAVHWFDSLSSGTKKFIGITALAVAALGPVLAIVGRVTKLIGIMWAAGAASGTFIAGITAAELSLTAMQTRAYGAGLAVRRAMAMGRGSVGMLTGALVGVGVGSAIGALTATGDAATKAGGVIASAAIGAAAGWAVGGPVGAALGGLGGALSAAAQSFGLFGGSAKNQVKPTDDFTQAIIRDNEAIGTNTRLVVANKLSKDGLFDAGRKLGLSSRTLTDAALGNSSALNLVNTALKYGILGNQDYKVAVDKLKKGLGNVAETLKVNRQAAKDLAEATATHKKKTDEATASLSKFTLTTDGVTASTYKAGAKIGGLFAAVGALQTKLDKFGRSKVDPRITVNPKSAHEKIRNLLLEIEDIKQGKVPGIDANTRKARLAIQILQAKLDALRNKTVYITAITNDVGRSVHDAVNGIPSSASTPIRSVRNAANAIPNGASKKPWKIGGTPAPSADDAKAAATQAAEDAKQAAQERADLRNAARSAGAALRAVGHNASASAADLMSAGIDFLKAGKAAGLTAAQLAGLRRSERQLASAGHRRDAISARLGSAASAPTAYDRLATARGNFADAKGAVRSAFTSSFDITSAGQGGNEPSSFRAIKRALDNAVRNAKRFTSVLRRLGKAGLNKVLLQQLADAGPSALPQALALVSATPKQLAALNSQAHTLNALGDKAGGRVAQSMYGAGVKSAEGLVAGLLSQEHALNKAIKRLADGMVATLRGELDMHSPSRRLFKEAALGWKGYANGVASQQKPVEDAARSVVNAGMPGRSGSQGASSTPGSAGVSGAAIGELHLHYAAADDYHRAKAQAMRHASTVMGR